MPTVCYIPNLYWQNCVYLYLVPLLLHNIGNLLAYVAALFETSFVLIVERSWPRDQDRALDSNCRFEANTFQISTDSRLISIFCLLRFIELLFGRVLASVCEAQLRLCVTLVRTSGLYYKLKFVGKR